MQAPQKALDQEQHLSFNLGNQTFAIGILHIKEIIEFGNLSSVPMMPEFIRGVINLRGSVVPVVDLAVRFGRAQAEIGRRTCIIILEVGEAHQDMGVIVDSVNEVLEIRGADIEAPPSFGAGIRSEFIAGMARHDTGFIILLDADRLLSASALGTLDVEDGAPS